MRIREINVKSNITETGCTNDFVSNINKIIECKNNFALIMQKYTLVINKGGEYHHIIFNRHKKSDDYDYDLVTCDQVRLTWYYQGLEKFHHSELRTYRILGIIKQIVDNNGETLTSYNGYEVNHLLPRVFKINNKIDNLELCTESENKRHFQAWLKCQIYDERISLKLSALGELVDFILSDKTVLVDKGNDYFILRNYNWDGDIVEYTCKLNKDGIWRFNG